jgi:hypothetical protein
MNKYQKAGKKGADTRWKPRYDTLKELSKYYDKKTMNWFQEVWKTEQLNVLLESILSQKNDKR